MTSNNTSTCSDETEVCEDFVVVTPYAPDVKQRLDAVGIKYKCASNAALGLTLFQPEDLGTQAKKDLLNAAVKKRRGLNRDDILEKVHRPEDPTPLDDLMFCLRFDYAESYELWIPAMGKNRTAHSVTGEPHVDPGSPGGSSLKYPARATKGDMAAEITIPTEGSPGSGVRVGILDTELYPHEALDDRCLVRPSDLLKRRNPYPYAAGHATFIAGLIAQEAPGAVLEVRQTLSNDLAQTTLWDLACKMVEFRDSGIQILNLSLGCFTDDDEAPMVLEYAVRLLAQDMVIVAAAGNHGDRAEDKCRFPEVTPESKFWPAALADVIAVGADEKDKGGLKVAPFSPSQPWVAFTAIGESVASTYLKGTVNIPDGQGGFDEEEFEDYARWSGTSFAAATVTGRIAARTKPGGSAWYAVNELKKDLHDRNDGPVRLFRAEGE
jgi:membrane-anchored mycosin MYCP